MPATLPAPFEIEPSSVEVQKQQNACPDSRKRFGGVVFAVILLCMIFFFVCRRTSGPNKSGDSACLHCTWSAVDPSAYELWDFNLVHGDEVANKMLSPELPANWLGKMKGVAQLSYAVSPPGVADSIFAKASLKTDRHPGKVSIKVHYNVGKAELKKKPINLEFEIPFFGMKRLALNPVYADCTGIVELVAARLYQTTMGFSPGTAPVRLFHSGKHLGLYTAIEWVTNDNFLDHAFPGAHKQGTRRVWEGRDHFSLEYVGQSPDLYKRGCREEGCTYCQQLNKVGGLQVCDRDAGVGEDCNTCWDREEVYQGKFCCAKPDAKPRYWLLTQDPSQASEDDEFKDLAKLVEIIHNATEKKLEVYIRRLESSFDVQAILDMAAVDVMIGNYEGYWATGSNYFIHQSGADSARSDIGKFSIFQIDFETMFSMSPSGEPYDSAYTLSWHFPTGLSMCSMPWKESIWPTSVGLGERKCVLDWIIAIPGYQARFIKKLRKVVDRAPEIIQMFQRWSHIIYPSRKIELEGHEHERWAIASKKLLTCSSENLQPQLDWYIDWINKRVEYLRQELAKMDEVVFA